MRLTQAHIERLAQIENTDRLSAEQVVIDATPAGSPLHDLFEWKDEVAAHLHRIDTARKIIRTVEVQITTTTRRIEVVKYVRDPDIGREQGYVSITAPRSRDSQRQTVIFELNRTIGNLERAKEIAQVYDLDFGGQEILNMLREWRGAVQGVDQITLLPPPTDPGNGNDQPDTPAQAAD
jgi:hypothetical protein